MNRGKNSNTVDFRGWEEGAVTLPRGATGRLFPSQRLNVDVSLRFVLFSLPSRAIFRFHVCGNPSRRSLNHTLFVSRRVLSARKAVHRARNSHPSIRPVTLSHPPFSCSLAHPSNRCFATTRGNPAGFLLFIPPR